MDALGFDADEVERTIRDGMKWKEDKANKWHARMAGIECVFTNEDDSIVVITVYTDGGTK